MAQHPIETIIEKTMQSISEMVDVNTIVGDTVVMGDGTLVIPISKVSYGLVAGGGQYGDPANEKSEPSFAGGGASGASLNPMAFLVINNGQVRLLPIQPYTAYERIIDKIPGLIDAICRGIGQDTADEAAQ